MCIRDRFTTAFFVRVRTSLDDKKLSKRGKLTLCFHFLIFEKSFLRLIISDWNTWDNKEQAIVHHQYNNSPILHIYSVHRFGHTHSRLTRGFLGISVFEQAYPWPLFLQIVLVAIGILASFTAGSCEDIRNFNKWTFCCRECPLFVHSVIFPFLIELSFVAFV